MYVKQQIRRLNIAHYDPADYWDEEDDDSPYSYRAYKEGRAACPAGVRSPDFEEIYSEDEFGNEEFAGCGRQITHIKTNLYRS